MKSAFQVAGPSIVHDLLDGEVVVLNMETGLYYSLTGVAAEVWQQVCQCHAVSHIVDGVSRRYTGEPTAIEGALRKFLQDLQSEKLISPAESPVEPDPDRTVVSDRPAFMAPVLSRYDDMEDLLLLDPVHEAPGWPTTRKPE